MNFWLWAAFNASSQMYSTIIFLHVKNLSISAHVTAELPPQEQKGQRLTLCAHTQCEDDGSSVNRTGWYGGDCRGETRWSQGR